MQTSLVLSISNCTAKTKLAILAFLYCGEFVKISRDADMQAQLKLVENYLCVTSLSPSLSCLTSLRVYESGGNNIIRS